MPASILSFFLFFNLRNVLIIYLLSLTYSCLLSAACCQCMNSELLKLNGPPGDRSGFLSVKMSVVMVSLTCMKQHVCVEAALEGKPSATLGAVEGLLSARLVDGLVGFELQQLGEGFPAVFAAQRLLALTLTRLLHSALAGLGLCNPFRSRGVARVTITWILCLKLTQKQYYFFIHFLLDHIFSFSATVG